MKKLLCNILFILLMSFSSRLQGQENQWPVFRGKSDLSGYTVQEVPAAPKLLWSFASGTRSASSPVISEGIIYFVTDKGSVIAVTPEGKQKWKYEGGGSAESPPLVYGNSVITGYSDGTLHAVDKGTGRLMWKYRTDNQIVGSANYWSTGKSAGIVVGSYDYYLHSVDPVTGRFQWKLETENYINGTPSVSNNSIVFGGCDGIIRVVDAYSGREKDTIQIGVYIASSPALSGGKACFGDYDGNLYCLDMLTGKLVWKIPANENSGSILAIPAMGKNSVIVGNEDKYLYCYDIITGKQRWKFRTNGRITGSAVITPSRVIFGSLDGYVYMLDLQDGRKLWSFNTGAPVSSSPAVVDNRFYFLTGDGRLIAFGNK
jgi:outer membrane protein assembly factor BamB